MDALARTSDRLFPSLPSFFGGEMMDWFNRNFADIDSTMPTVNVKETGNEFQIEVAAPGMSKKDFNINYQNGQLTISSEKKEEKKEGKKGDRFLRREFSYQSFSRSFAVSENLVNPDKISARYEDGILHVSLPKSEGAKPKPAKEIKIS